MKSVLIKLPAYSFDLKNSQGHLMYKITVKKKKNIEILLILVNDFVVLSIGHLHKGLGYN